MTHGDLDIIDDIDATAARWYSRGRSGEMTRAEEAQLEAWLEADPAHRAAYDAVEQAWSALSLIRAHPRMLAMRDKLPAEPPRLLGRRVVRWAMAACLALAMLGAGLTAGWDLTRPAGLYEDKAFVTGAGQRSVVTLADGSEVVLNSGTVMRTRAVADQRLIYLDKGQAFFRVAKDPEHPFVVQAGGRTITAVGTAFDVRVEPERFAITLVEGKVRVETPVLTPAEPRTPRVRHAPDAPAVETTEMIAGSQLVAADVARWSVARTDVEQATSWARDQLVFQAQPLSEVVAEMNRRSARKIVIADPEVGEILVSGNFRPGDVEGFARAVQAYDYARISSDSAGRIELSAH